MVSKLWKELKALTVPEEYHSLAYPFFSTHLFVRKDVKLPLKWFFDATMHVFIRNFQTYYRYYYYHHFRSLHNSICDSHNQLRKWKILLERTLTTCMPLLIMATSTFTLGRRCWSSQQCCLHCLHIISKLLFFKIIKHNENIISGLEHLKTCKN